MTADDDRLRPGWHQARDVADDDRLAEDDTTEDVADGAVWRLPHLLQAELFNTGFVWSDRRALDADAVLQDGIGRVNGDLIISCIAVLNAEVVVLQVDIEVLQDQFILDELPDDARHFVAIKLNDRVGYLDLAQLLLLVGRCRRSSVRWVAALQRASSSGDSAVSQSRDP